MSAAELTADLELLVSATTLDARTAAFAGPVLSRFNAAAVLSSADVHVAQRLGRLAGESDERVLLAVALAVRAVRAGSVCVALDDLDALAVAEAEEAEPVDDLPWPAPAQWRALLEASPLVAVGARGPVDRPVRWVSGRLYLDRYWRHEQVVRGQIDARLRAAPLLVDADRLSEAVHRLLPADDATRPADGRQRIAAAMAVLSPLTVLTGGPGTGKTTTVARVLAVLQSVAGPELRIALAAPTGKAAARLEQAVRAEVDRLPPTDRVAVGTPPASTVHRLLGWKPGTSTRFRHDRDHHLPHDVVVVDETSMVSLTLMARLLEALRPGARLLLVGDPDQLASVEAGAVLGDLVARPPVADRLPDALEAVLPADLNEVLGSDSSGAGPSRAGSLTAPEPTGPSAAASTTAVERSASTTPTGAGAAGLGQETSGAAPGAPSAPTAPTATSSATTATARAALRNGVVRLERVHRHGAVIGRLATAIRQGRVDEAFAALRGGEPAVEFVETAGERPSDAEITGLRRDAESAGARLVAAAQAGDAAAALGALELHRLLLAHRRGPAGVAHWAAQVEAWVAAAAGPGSEPSPGPWYPGRPLLVTTNDRDTGLFNGDTGVVVADGGGGVVAVFGDSDKPLRVRPHRLPPVETVHAMTVHRGQGSQFGTVSVLLPPATSPLLTRELLYTAVTRARERVRVVGTDAAVRAAIERPVRRASGLRFPLD